MNILSFIGISLIILVISTMIKKYYPEFFISFEIIFISIVYVILIPDTQNIVNELKHLFELAKISTDLQSSLLKILGICIISQIGIDICKDSGSISLANNISLFGKLSMILASIPIFKNFLNMTLTALRESCP